MKAVDVKLERLSDVTPEEFAPYGYIVGRKETSKLTMENTGSNLTVYWELLPVLKGEKGVLSVALLTFKPKDPGKLTDWMECHKGTAECFIPMGGKEIVYVGAPAGDKPDVDKARAFIVGPDEGIVIPKGVWHCAPYALNGPTQCLMPRYGDLVETDGGFLDSRKTVCYGSKANDGTEMSIRLIF